MISFERLKRAALTVPLTGPLAMTIALLALGGCSTNPPPRPTSDQYLVEPVRFSHQVTFASGAADLTLASADELVAFLDEVDPDGRADIYLDAQGPERDRRMDVVGGFLRELGRQSSGAGGAAPTDIGVVVTVADDILLPASCMDNDQWPHPDLPPANCANALTLVRMLEDPDDLLRGRRMGHAPAARAAEAYARLRQRGQEPIDVPAGGQQALPPSEGGVSY